MNSPKYALKVGIFVFAALVVLAILLLSFSKGLTLFKPSYRLHVVMRNMAGLKPKAGVMMAGVPIGSVENIELGRDGRTVNITIKILEKYKIYPDANIHIDALGFLGDQYIEITPTKNEGHPLEDGSTVTGVEPFNLQEAVRSTSSLLESAREMMKSLDQAITNINRTILSDQTLTNFGLAISNLEMVTADAVLIASNAQTLLSTNTPAINGAVSNLQAASQKLTNIADDVSTTIIRNTNKVSEIMTNLRDTSTNLLAISQEYRAGKGIIPTLFTNSQMRDDLSAVMTNVNQLAANLSLFSSNLNQQGVWRMLWKPKAPKAEPPEGKHGK
jgi:phospholipid/cholesterol/gamma-HCH transport system substrate-binding protein